MSDASKNNPSRREVTIRDTLFGDLPLDAWPQASSSSESEPWHSFVQARETLAAGSAAEATVLWQRITKMPGLESRHYLQAWHFLRQHNLPPPSNQAKILLGVVLEVPMDGGLDLLAAYPERHARYYNFSGSAVIWEHPNTSLDDLIDAVLHAGQGILNVIGPWNGQRPAAPPPGSIRMNLFSPAGLHFGQGPFAAMAKDPTAKPLIDSAVALMQALIAQTPQP